MLLKFLTSFSASLCPQSSETAQRFYFKLAARLVREHDLMCAENLNVNGLAQGKLSKSVLDAGWSVFLYQILPRKAWSAGREVIYVNATRQPCAECGGFSVHHDINSVLIVKLGVEQTCRGLGTFSHACMKLSAEGEASTRSIIFTVQVQNMLTNLHYGRTCFFTKLKAEISDSLKPLMSTLKSVSNLAV
ncbi:transposase [Thermotoga caldifontis]|uniref:transposase n=1 Tax=Thermotoga caldifontis TaxID=1508419 RepID=UPI00069500D9|nr:transposase [Thermotoga caldifontis]